MSKKTLIIIISSVIAVISAIVAVLVITNNNVKYTVTFNSDGGTLVQEQIIKKGEKVIKPSDPIKTGYRFISWLYQDEEYDFSLGVTSDIELKANWYKIKEEAKEYIVKFNTNGGTTIPNQIIEEGNKITKPKDPTKEGYEFKGWYHEDKEFDFENKVTKDIELEAKWEEIKVPENNDNNKPVTPAVKKYTVTFDTKGGSSISSKTVEEGSKVEKPTDPTREGYTFAGWTLNGTNYDFNKSVTGNITLVASWNEIRLDQIKKPTLTISFTSSGNPSSSKVPTIKNGYYTYDLVSVDMDNYIQNNEPIVNGYEIYEKSDDTYNKVLTTTDVEKVEELTIEVGTSKTYVARVYITDSTNKKYYSEYSNEVTLDHTTIETPTLTNSKGYATNQIVIKTELDIISEGIYTSEESWNKISGWELYEKAENEYKLIDSKETAYIEVTVDIGESKTYVARTYALNKNNEKVYSEYSNEIKIENKVKYGDVREDGTINTRDLIDIQSYIEGTTELTEKQKKAADVNLDGKIDDKDLDILAKYISGDYGIDKLPYIQ